ncbi:MAG: DUF3365 domain-containing protein [Rubripirellula sp.]|nr:DUF3365 domain-containing protein [Rubripirellula sp.]
MMVFSKWSICLAILFLGCFVCSSWSVRAHENKDRSAAETATERTRDTVRMLDDVYKTAVVLITTHYVNDEDDLPAGTAAIALFDAVNKKGWHEVRLLDASGEPINDANVAQDKFEREGVAKLKSGKNWHETIVTEKGKRHLRVVTPIPVVLEKCTMCHENYKEFKQGEPIGAISYKIPIR